MISFAVILVVNLVVNLAFVTQPASATEGGVNSGTSATVATRLLHFPPDKSLGAIILGVKNAYMDTTGPRPQVASAIGNVKVSVPTGHYILFEANRRIFENPDLLNKINQEGVDVLKIGFMSMDDKEDAMCDRALSHLSHWTALKGLEVNRSDATDAGMSHVKELKNLRWLSCVQSDITGSFFKVLPALPELSELNCSWCALNESNIAYLSQVKSLTQLDLSRTGLSEVGMRELSKCTGLTVLRIGMNPNLTDECLKQLLPIKNLDWLDLRETRVTMNGLRYLKTLKFRKLAVPAQIDSPANIAELKKQYPGVYLLHGDRAHVSGETMETFAPLK